MEGRLSSGMHSTAVFYLSAKKPLLAVQTASAIKHLRHVTVAMMTR